MSVSSAHHKLYCELKAKEENLTGELNNGSFKCSTECWRWEKKETFNWCHCIM